MKKKYIISLLAFALSLFFSKNSFAQFDLFIHPEQHQNVYKQQISVSFVPTSILQNNIRLDFEYLDKKKAYVISPRFYFINRQTHPVSYGNTDVYKLFGGGLGFYRKFVRGSDKKFYGYFAIGGSYAFLTSEFQEYVWNKTNLYDNTVYSYDLTNISAKIHQLQASVTAGIQQNFANIIFADIFVGVGYQYSVPIFSQKIENPFDRPYSLAYSGPIFLAGIKLGIAKDLQQQPQDQ